jgi:hypothetical protein
LAHNIIYAGYEYALELGINPHQDFKFTKFILEEDDDEIPLIDIEVGGKGGVPHLLITDGNPAKYKPVYNHLLKTLGEGNFIHTSEEHIGSNNLYDVIEDDAIDELIVKRMEKEEVLLGFADSMDEYKLGEINPFTVRFIKTEEIGDKKSMKARTEKEQMAITLEVFFRSMKNIAPTFVLDTKQNKYINDFRNSIESIRLMPLWMTNEQAEEMEVGQKAMEKAIEAIPKIDDEELYTEKVSNAFIKSMKPYHHNPLLVAKLYEHLLVENEIEAEKIKPTIKRQAMQYPISKLMYALGTVYQRKPDSSIDYIYKETDIHKIFPNLKEVSYIELELFWTMRLFLSIDDDNLQSAVYYYKLLSSFGIVSCGMFPFAQEEFCEAIAESVG